jgi:hypothetical protein
LQSSREDAVVVVDSSQRFRHVARVAAATVLLGAVAVGARAGLPDGGRFHAVASGAGGSRVLLGVASAAFVLVVAAFAVGVGGLLSGRRRKGSQEQVLVRSEIEFKAWERILVVTVPALLLVGLVALIVYSSAQKHAPPPPLPSQSAATSTTSSTAGPTANGPSSGDESAIELGALVGGVTIAGALLALVIARRRRPAPEPSEERRVAVNVAAGNSIADVRRERDPRRAIIAAYGRMERLLADVGAPRLAAETQYEYLGRVLTEAHAPPDAALELTALFVEARFSEHELTQANRSDALDALIRIRDATSR